MSRIHGANTKPELEVRKRLHSMGFRYCLHYSKLPGKPDIVLPKHKKIIFVHGCFWHGHPGCKRSKLPTTNVDFWQRKISSNIARDLEVQKELARRGWKILTIWSCETRKSEYLISKIEEFMNGR